MRGIDPLSPSVSLYVEAPMQQPLQQIDKYGNTVVDGKLEKGEIHGLGKIIYRDDSEILSEEGNFYRGSLDGQGTRIYRDGGVDEGDFCRGDLHGTGVKILSCGTILRGSFNYGFFSPPALEDQKK